MHDLLMVLKEFAIYDDELKGRRVLRVGTIVNLPPDIAARYVSKGYARLMQPAAPLFAEATNPPKKPKKKAKESPPDGT